jgi:FixJ family two-component response regulator
MRMVSIVDDDGSLRRFVGTFLTSVRFRGETLSAEAFLESVHPENTGLGVARGGACE